jgi:beta-lactamase regulating signal transducer with metallopeptidase domain
MPAYLSYLTVLGWSLLDSIWQMAILWMVYWLLTAGNNRISPAGKHNMVLLFAFISTEWFIYSLVHQSKEPGSGLIEGILPVIGYANRWIPFISTIYLICLFARLIHSFYQQHLFRKKNTGRDPSPAYQLFADRYSRLMGVRRKVQVFLSELAETAETGGIFKPVILLPVSLVTRLSPQQLEAILVHELFHIRRNDFFVNICMSCFRGIFFFNPFAHLFYKAMAKERELACDDGVLEMGFEPGVYADALYSLEKYRQPHPGFSLAADGNRPWLLMERIRRLLGKPVSGSRKLNPVFYFILMLSISLAGLRATTKKPLESPKKTIPVSSDMVYRYNVTIKKSGLSAPEISPRLVINLKPGKKKNANVPAPATMAAEPDNEETMEPAAYFADQKVVHEFSNQMAADLTRDAIPENPGSPYVPSASLYYQAMPVIVSEDSIKAVLVQNGIKDMVGLSRLKSIANLKTLEIQIEKSRKLLNEEVLKNQELIKLNRGKLNPELNQIRHKMDTRKKSIEHLRVRLQDEEEEIIHI